MSTWYLLNDVIISDLVGAGGAATRLWAGKLIDDTKVPIAPIQAAGGILWPASDLSVASAAAIAQLYRKRGQGDPEFGLAIGALLAAAIASPSNIEHYVRGVVTANVSSLAAFTVAGNDGLTYTQGQRVLLAGQTTASQNGVYVVGVVSGTTAPLQRPTDWATGASLPAGTIVEVSEGTLWNNTQWKVTTTGAITIDTTNIVLYPRQMRGTSAAMSAGTITISSVWLLAGATIQLTENTSGGTVGTLKAAAASRTAGAGNGSFVIASSSGSDTSTVDWMITNC